MRQFIRGERMTMTKRKQVKVKEPETVEDSELERILAQTLKEDEARLQRALKSVDVECPYCGEEVEICIDGPTLNVAA